MVWHRTLGVNDPTTCRVYPRDGKLKPSTNFQGVTEKTRVFYLHLLLKFKGFFEKND